MKTEPEIRTEIARLEKWIDDSNLKAEEAREAGDAPGVNLYKARRYPTRVRIDELLWVLGEDGDTMWREIMKKQGARDSELPERM